jgi:hypothetical protein
MSGEEARRFYAQIAEEISELQATSRPDALDNLAEDLGAEEKELLAEAEIDEAKVEGDTATVRPRVKSSEMSADDRGVRHRW